MTKNLGVLVSLVESVQTHPQSFRLKICQVFDGSRRVQVVCGASNVREGMRTILAHENSTLPTGKIMTKTVIRGVTSAGMLCSAKDLGISQESGIVDLPPHVDLGKSLSDIDQEYLSSIPWYQYEEVESFWKLKNGRDIVVERGRQDQASTQHNHDQFKLLTKTYYYQGKFWYRHYC